MLYLYTNQYICRNELEESMKETNKEKQVEKPNPNEPIFASSSQGLLRTKIEAGTYKLSVSNLDMLVGQTDICVLVIMFMYCTY